MLRWKHCPTPAPALEDGVRTARAGRPARGAVTEAAAAGPVVLVLVVPDTTVDATKLRVVDARAHIHYLRVELVNVPAYTPCTQIQVDENSYQLTS